MSNPPPSDTPRTDSESKRIKLDPDIDIGSERQAMAIFARKLERELNEARKDAEDLATALNSFRDTVLHERSSFSEENAPVNLILGEFDLAMAPALAAHNALTTKGNSQ